VPEGPLRGRFARYGTVIDGTVSLPLWGGSAGSWLRRLARTVRDSVRLARVIRRQDIRLVLTNSSVSVAPVLAGRLAAVPVIVHMRDVPASRLASRVFRLHGRIAQTVIIITGGMRHFFKAKSRARIVQIPDGIELPGPRVGAPPPRSSSSAAEHPVRLCLIGGIDPRKGQDIAIEALAELKDRGVDADLDLVGREIDTEFAASLRERANDLGVATRVTFVGELADVPAHLRDVDIVIAPSRREWTPLALMEALALEKPVVAANVGGVRDVVSDHQTGLLVPPEDPRRLADAVVELVTDPFEASVMASNGRQSVEAGFSLTGTLSGVEQEVHHLLGCTRPTQAQSPAARSLGA